MVKHEAGTDWYLQDEEEYNDKCNLQKVKRLVKETVVVVENEIQCTVMSSLKGFILLISGICFIPQPFLTVPLMLNYAESYHIRQNFVKTPIASAAYIN